MSDKPFLKWAGGKRWLVERRDFQLPTYAGSYIEPFLGGGAMFFSHRPPKAILSDTNARLIETYEVIKGNWQGLVRLLGRYHGAHCSEYYYKQRARLPETSLGRAAQFVYLNRACWNGLYRVNREGAFNVPVGTKDWILSDSDDFKQVAASLASATLIASDFEEVVGRAVAGDLVFADPPYTAAHNFNGFVKYNERMFSWADQVRLARVLREATERGVTVVATNADHPSVRELYDDFADIASLKRASVISGRSKGRQETTELLIRANP